MSNPQRPAPTARSHSSDSRRSDRPREAAPRDSYTTSSRPPTTGYAQQQQQQQHQQYAQSAYYPPDPTGRRSLRYSNAVLPSQAYPYAAAQQAQQQQYHLPSAAHQQPVGSPTLAAPTTPELGNGDWGHNGTPASPTSPAYGDESAPLTSATGAHQQSLHPSQNYPYSNANPAASRSSLFNDSSSTFANSTTKLASYDDGFDEKVAVPVLPSSKRVAKPASTIEASSNRRKKLFLLIGVLVLAGIVAAAAVGITNAHRSSVKAEEGDAAGAGASSSGAGAAPAPTTPTTTAPPPLATSGGDGSVITDENGNTFTYKNPFGGKWVSTPFDDSAQAQSDVPPLNQPWDYANTRIYGVNLGGWLTLEPFITPDLYEPYMNAATPAIDEWTLCQNLGANMAQTITNHYETFITEEDFAMIAGAGLNWVRISIPYWAIEVYDGEPFLEGVAWTYFLKAITWARKYGIRINLDYHATPGSQNGWNHSSKMGSVNFLVGVMGIANAQRALNYIRTLSEFISQPQYKNVVPMQGIINEALLATITPAPLRSFYLEAYNMIRAIGGTGQGNGPMLTIHDGFAGQTQWYGFLQGADRVALDTHPYLCFAPQANTATMQQNIMTPCSQWGQSYNQTFTEFGFAMAGEWSLAVNDCGIFVNGVGLGTRIEGTYPTPETSTTQRVGSCNPWLDVTTWSDQLKAQFQQLQYAHQDALGNTFFWTWKIGNTTQTNPPRVANPMWSYRYGLEQGYISANPRQAVGQCLVMANQFGVAAPQQVPWSGQFSAYMTGGAANPTVAAAQVRAYGTWPPASIVGVPDVAANAPQYTPTGTVVTLAGASPNVTIPGSTGTIGPGNGWAQPTDTASWYTPIAGCNAYVNPWSGSDAPTGAIPGCTPAAAAAAAANPQKREIKPTPAPHQKRRQPLPHGKK